MDIPVELFLSVIVRPVAALQVFRALFHILSRVLGGQLSVSRTRELPGVGVWPGPVPDSLPQGAALVWGKWPKCGFYFIASQQVSRMTKGLLPYPGQGFFSGLLCISHLLPGVQTGVCVLLIVLDV